LIFLPQAIVDHNDLAFKNPTKPIGGFYSEQEAKKITKETG
jgi:carbamate kinase